MKRSANASENEMQAAAHRLQAILEATYHALRPHALTNQLIHWLEYILRVVGISDSIMGPLPKINWVEGQRGR